MEYILYLGRFLYRIRWWLLIGTAVITLAAYLITANMNKTYTVEATLYTGVVSGYSIESDGGGKMDWAATQNAMDNLINIIKAESTLKRVSYRLFARILIGGNADSDTDNVTAASYNYTYNHMKNSPHGPELIALIDKTSEDKTVENFIQYERPNRDNYIYGVFYFNHRYCSYNILKSIEVIRKGNSDLLEIKYSSDDPFIAYNAISILMSEFVNEYRAIRYGETDKVIEYFRSELSRIGKELRINEDSLTQYNVDHRIINYYDETKEIAAINKEFELREQDVLFAYNSSKAMMETLEKQMDMNTKQALNNIQLLNKLKEASSLAGKITEMETLPSQEQGEQKGTSLKAYQDKLTTTRKELSTISDIYVGHKETKEGIAKATIVEQWLDQVLLFEKAKAELSIVQRSRQELSDKYTFFAPVGSNIKRKERNINFTEQNYLSLLKSYNDALMRKKSLEMTSATLKVLNPPALPITPEPTHRKQIVMAACAGSFLFILGFFLLLEFLDRTLRDSIRTRRLIGCHVLGAYPEPSLLKRRSNNKRCDAIATKYLSSSLLRFCTERKQGQPYLINVLSTHSGDGKSYLSDQVLEYWKKIGLNVRKLTWGVDFDPNSRQYALAKSIDDLYTYHNEDLLIVEHPSLTDNNVPSELLRQADLNLLIAPANRGWRETDKLLSEKLKTQVGASPLYVYLNRASRQVVEDYTGMLPPYTLTRKLLYRFSQLALTEKTSLFSPAPHRKDDENDD